MTSSAVIVHPQAYGVMALHAIHHKYESVYGLLLGSTTEDGKSGKILTNVHTVVPLSHGVPPTHPLIEVALGLCAHDGGEDASSSVVVVGCYTGPCLHQDSQPGPVAERLAFGLTAPSAASAPPCLIVIQNELLGSALKGDNEASYRIFKATCRGKDMELVVQDSIKVIKATREAVERGLVVEDLEDHLDNSSPSESSWPHFANFGEIIKSF